jgi:hypothetical protein
MGNGGCGRVKQLMGGAGDRQALVTMASSAVAA